MAESNWRTLLDDPEVERIINQAFNRHGKRYYWRRVDALLLDDLESWIWDYAVTLAISWDPDTYGLPSEAWYGWFATQLREVILNGWHRTKYNGHAGTARWHGSYAQVSLDAAHDAFGDHLESVVLANRRLTPNDPLVVVLRCEHLEALLRRAIVVDRHRPLYVTRDPDPYCDEPMCTRPVFAARKCSTHYGRQRMYDAEMCTVDGCTNGAKGNGLCSAHYAAAARRDPNRPRCATEGCDGAARTRGLCDRCYIAASKAGTLPPRPERQAGPCSTEGCERPVKAKGKCHPCYTAARQKERAVRDDLPTCTIPGCDRVVYAKALCQSHYKTERKRAQRQAAKR